MDRAIQRDGTGTRVLGGSDKDLADRRVEAPAAVDDAAREDASSIQPAGDDEARNPNRWVILLAMMLAVIMVVLDTSSIMPALPMMQGNLGASPDEINWVGTGYILATVIVLPMTAWFSQRIGRRDYLVWSILLFTFASLMCGLSNTLSTVVFWRIVEGVAGAGIMSIGQSTIIEVFPKKQMAFTQALYTVGIMAAPTLGPAFGGWMVDNYSWPYIFLSKFPLGLLAAYLVGKYLHDSPHKNASDAIDWVGIASLAVGLGCLQYVLEEGQRYDWFEDSVILKTSIVSLITLVFFIGWELRPKNDAPVVELRVLRDRGLAVGVFLCLLLGFANFSASFLFPIFVQGVLHFTPTESGLALMPGGILTGVGVMISGQLIQRGVQPRNLVFFGIPVTCLSMWMMGHLTPLSSFDDAQLGLMVRGFGLGFISTPITIAAFTTLHGRDIAAGSGLLNLIRQLGGSFGIAILGSYVTSQTQVHRCDLVTNLFSGNPLFQNRVAMQAAGLCASGFSRGSARLASLALVSHSVQLQAATMAYNDAYILVGITLALVFPAAFLFKKRTR
ncbi:MAG: DHA2 family efflux MFS transporter permease subunit [Capsulimonadaceae bacterium]|nr:DHA2 family efflux MFS transporter permease subunit [Capsulimonadaceae bacterium]